MAEYEIPESSFLAGWNGFQLNVESNIVFGFVWFCFITFYDWLAILAPLSQPMRSKTKTMMTCAKAFSRAWRRLHVLAST